MSKIFISYRHVEPDQNLAQFAEHHLKNRGHEVFVDTQILVGTRWAEEIEKQLRGSDFFIVLLSQNSILSDMLRREVQLAHEIAFSPEENIVILPVRVNFLGALPYDLGAYLNPIQYSVWRSGEPFEKITSELTLSIEKMAELPNAGSENDLQVHDLDELFDTTEKIGAPLPNCDPRFMSNLHMDTGAVKSTSPFYVERDSDKKLLKQIMMEGSTTVIKGARQSGKSSLLARAHNSYRHEKRKSFYLDFQLLDAEVLENLDSLCRYIGRKLAQVFRVKIKPDEVWKKDLGPKENLTNFLEQAVLFDLDRPVLFLLDEADKVFDYDYRDDFFALIRAWHNLRPIQEEWDNLNLVIAHATEPYLWIQDINQSPFNVGISIILSDFSFDQTSYLNDKHMQPLKSEIELQEMRDLVGGQPYLVRQALYSLSTRNWSIKQLQKAAADDRGPFGDHLRWYIWCLKRHDDLKPSLRQILRNGRCDDEMQFMKLKAAGLIKGEERQSVQMRCQLYADYFGKHL